MQPSNDFHVNQKLYITKFSGYFAMYSKELTNQYTVAKNSQK